jgi:hypothetical protein
MERLARDLTLQLSQKFQKLHTKKVLQHLPIWHNETVCVTFAADLQLPDHDGGLPEPRDAVQTRRDLPGQYLIKLFMAVIYKFL